MDSLPTHEQANQISVQNANRSSTLKPVFVWSFVMNVPDSQPQSLSKNPRENHEGRANLTPRKAKDDNLSMNSEISLSLVDKNNEFSPFRTTCQKRAENSPISPTLWKRANSTLKKHKQSTMHSMGSLFHLSTEKKKLFERPENLKEPVAFHNEVLLFPDLEGNTYEYSAADNVNNIGEMAHNFSNSRPPSFSKSNPEDKSKSKPNEDQFNLKKNSTKEKTNSEDGCNCRNTKCLKLYCECLRKGSTCGEHCNCTGCENHPSSELRKARIQIIEKKNPNAFKPIITERNESEAVRVHNRGCNCRRSGCLKNYCECHQFGVRCTESCKCSECKNTVWLRNEAPKSGVKNSTLKESRGDMKIPKKGQKSA
jgi:hypothetical protein